MNEKLVKVLSLSPIALLPACSGMHTKKWEDANDEYRATEMEMTLKSQDMKPKEMSYFELKDTSYVDTNPIKVLKSISDLPQNFYQPIEMYSSDPIELNQLASEIFKQAGIVIQFIKNDKPSKQQLAKDNVADDSQVANPFNTDNQFQESTNTTAKISESEILVDFSGDVKGLLDYIGIKKNLKWKFDERSQRIYFYPFETETFTIFAVSEDISIKSSISTKNNSSTSGGGGGSESDSKSDNSQDIEFKQEQKYWEDVKETVTGMLSSEGRANFNKTQGKITITDNDFNIQMVGDYIANLNEDAYKQVTVDFKIVNLKLDDNRDISVDMNFINGQLSTAFDNNNPVSVLGSLAFKSKSGKSNILFNVLDELGKAKVETDISVLTVNNLPVPIQVSKSTAYISDVETNSSSEGSDNLGTSYTTDIVSEGITATITPKAIGQNVLLNYSMNLSVLDSLETAEGGVQLPITSNKNFVQRTTLRNGESRVIAAFEKTDTKIGSKHPLTQKLWFLGGGESMSKQKEIILLIATPYISTVKE